MPAGVEIGLLGALQVRCGGSTVAVPAGKQRALLAALLLQAGRTVRADQLAELLWAPHLPPSTAPAALRNYVMRLRRALGPAGQHLIQTRPGGYLITPDDCELDLARFDQELAAARAAARDGDWQEATVHADAALGWWRGQPLSDVDLPALTAERVPQLTEMRLQAQELRIEADLALTRHAEAVTELPPLIAANPVRERLYALLMLAYYRCGRRAEALDTYRAAHDTLAEDIGANPGPELQALHQQILHDDPALAQLPTHGTPAGPSSPLSAGRSGAGIGAVPRQLPAPVACFTGRETELAALTGLLDSQEDGAAPALLISAIDGTAGVGKTALAVQWAHQVAGQFPDGQLYVNMRGYDLDAPVIPGDALASLLTALGVPGQQVPDSLEDRARLYRSKLAGRRALVLLDNARNGEQVRPLLPGDPGCIAVVTSRDSLAGLVAADGARRLDLDVLPLTDAVGLLRSLIGRRADEDLEAAEKLAGLCARLPLALRIAADRAATSPATPLADLATELASARLDVLDAGEDRADVRAVFSWSVRQLPGDMAAAFALLGLHPGEDIDAYAAAALTGTSPGQARRMLEWLRRASLIQAAGPGRYGMHDLLRTYARELAAARQQAAGRDVGPECEQALTRLFDYCLATAAGAMNILHPAEAHRRPPVPPTAAVVPAMPREEDARAWLDAERANLTAMVVHCADRSWPEHVARLSGTLFRYLMTGSHLPEADTIYSHALQAARRSGDVAAEAGALNRLGGIGMMKGNDRDAAGHYQAALERYRQCGNQASEGRVLENLAGIESRLHNHQAAAAYYHQAIAASENAGDRLAVAAALSGLAASETDLGHYDRAGEHLQLALRVFGDENDHVREAQALGRLGELSLRRGHLAQAADSFEQALAKSRHIGKPTGVAAQLLNLATVSVRQGEYQKAIGNLRQALPLYRQAGYRYGEINTLLALAEALHGAGRPAAARAELETALRLAAETGNTHQQAAAHRDLADSYHSAGQDEQARHHWRKAMGLYSQLGAHEADEIRSRLDCPEAQQGVQAAMG
jgi:DNA-binding SARP family transcriptional activator